MPQGVAKASEGNVAWIWACTCLLSVMDLTAPEAQPIVRGLEGMGSTLRFVLENDCSHIVDYGYTSAAHTSGTGAANTSPRVASPSMVANVCWLYHLSKPRWAENGCMDSYSLSQ